MAVYCCHRDKSTVESGRKKRKIVPQKEQNQDEEDDDGGQWDVVGGKRLNQEAIFQDKVKQLFPKDIEVNEKNLLKKRQELLDGHCKTVRNMCM